MTQTKSRKKRIYITLAIVALIAIWLIGDYVHSRIVTARVQEWESTIERDQQGVQLGARSYTIDRGATALLLIHGYNDTPQAFHKMAPALADRGFTIRAVRLPGFGVSIDKMQSCTYEQWIETARDEVGQLRQRYDRVVIVGHSLGGAVAIGFLLEYQEMVEGVVLLAPAVAVANHRSPLFTTRFWRTFGEYLFVFTDVYHSPFDKNDARDPAERNPTYKPAFSTQNIVTQSLRLIDANRNGAKRIEIPLLMILSRNDQLIDWVAAESFYQQVASQNKLLEFYDTSGHALTVDYDWEQIVDEIASFVDSIE